MKVKQEVATSYKQQVTPGNTCSNTWIIWVWPAKWVWSKLGVVGVVMGMIGGSWPTSSLAEMVEAGVVGSELGEVVVPIPELSESPSPATSWISLARMARSLARS